MSNNTLQTNTADQAWYDDLVDPDLGVVNGMSNAVFFGIIIGGIVAVAGLVGLIYHCKRKKELEAMVQAEEDKKKHAAGNAVAPVDIYEEMEGELEKHEKQKKKLQKYLSFLLNKDAQGLMTINQKRVANAQRARNNYWF